MIFCVYKDDGPKGICGQDCYTTSNWSELHIFRDYQQFREFEQSVLECSSRKNARVTDFWDNEANCPGDSVYYQNVSLRYVDIKFMDQNSGMYIK
jgi:hypothetical protein